MCGREPGKQKVLDAVKASGGSFLRVVIAPDRLLKDRQGVLKDTSLLIEDLHDSTEFILSGFRSEKDLFVTAAGRGYIREHLESTALNLQSLQIFAILEKSQMGVVLASGRKLKKANTHMSELLGYTPEAIHSLESPDLFLSRDSYQEFSCSMSRDKNEAGWHCSSHTLVTIDRQGVSCAIMVRRLDGIDPSKGHLMIIEKTPDAGLSSREFLQVMTEERVHSGSFDEIIAKFREIVITTDREGTITHINATASGTFGYQPEDITGKNLTGTIVPDQSRYARRMITMINDPVFS